MNQETFQLAHRRTIKIVEDRQEAKQVGNMAEVRRLNSISKRKKDR